MRVAAGTSLLVGVALMAGCASKPEDVSASYVSPVVYQSLSCQQLAVEAQNVSNRATVLTGQQSKQRTRDTVATTAAVVIFLPVAFLVGGNDAQTAELARMKGEMNAIQQASLGKRCGIQFQS